MTYSKEDAERDRLTSERAAELLRQIRAGRLDPRNAARELIGEYDQDFITGVLGLAARAGSMWEPDWSISLDGDHKISDVRRNMARWLMDSRLSDYEAIGYAAYHPRVTGLNKKLSPTRGVSRGDLQKAGLQADLPESFRWNDESLSCLQAGKQVATEAILALIPEDH